MAMSAQARSTDALLRAAHGTDLEALLARLKTEGTSLRGIARHLLDLTDGVVDVSPQTIANWLDDLEEVAS